MRASLQPETDDRAEHGIGCTGPYSHRRKIGRVHFPALLGFGIPTANSRIANRGIIGREPSKT